MIKLLSFISATLLILFLCACSSSSNALAYDTKYAQSKIVERCESKGLSGVSVEVKPYKTLDEYKFCSVIITCSGFESFEGEDMYSCLDSINNMLIPDSKLLWLDSDITITSGGHTYTYTEGYNDIGRSGYVYRDRNQFYEKKYSNGGTNTTSGKSQLSADSGTRHTNAEAFACAQNIVEGKLKSPSTAKYCKVTEATITHDGDKYTVNGWVDAENSFGATVRTYFTVTYTATAKGYKNASVTFD